MPELHQWRQTHSQLLATVRLTTFRGENTLRVNLRDPLIGDSLVIDLAGDRDCQAVSLEVAAAGGQSLHASRTSPVPTVPLVEALPAPQQAFAAVEPGTKLARSAGPRIVLPDPRQLRIQTLGPAQRAVTAAAITFPVVTNADLPGIASNNAIILSRQTANAGDATKASLYFSYRKALYEPGYAQLKEWRKMLVEVPLDRAWLDKQGDELISLPLDQFAIHTTEERELANPRWNDPRGYNMLGGSSSGLYQGGQSAEVDEQGRIYISNIPDGAGLVRFNPHLARFEQPPVNLLAELGKFIPANGDTKLGWDTELAQLVCAHGRLFIVFDRHYRNKTPNGIFETCSGVVSLPLEHWDDPAVFRRELRLHAACWPNAAFPLYADDIALGGYRRLGVPPQATRHGIVFGEYRLDLDADGNSQRLSRIKSVRDVIDHNDMPLAPTELAMIKGLPRQRFINVGGAGRQFVRQAYGECSMSRAALALSMPDAPADMIADSTGRHRVTFPNAPRGQLTVRFDITNKIAREPNRYAVLAASMTGPSQGPTYAVIEAPGEPDQAIGVCEYSYFYSKLDFSRRLADGKVYKRYLPLMSNGQLTTQPATVGVGPYNSAWIEHDNARWLYTPGYTGITRIKYAADGKLLAGVCFESIHDQLKAQPIDGIGRDGVKDFLYVLPAIDNRLINIGRGRYGRGGGARSAGLELFHPSVLGESRTAVEMNRCYGLFTPVSRLVLSAAGQPSRQEIYVASGEIRPEYVEDIEDRNRRPVNQDPKIFVYDCVAGAGLRDLYGFALPVNPVGGNAANLALSPCCQFLVVLQGNGTAWTYSLAQRRFVDGVQLRSAAGVPIQPLSFSRPSAWIWTGPSGQLFFHAAINGEKANSVNFFTIAVTPAGRINVAPHLMVTSEKAGMVDDFRRIVRCFLPDLVRRDGSYDLVLGGDADNGGQPTVRVIDDFIPPRKR